MRRTFTVLALVVVTLTAGCTGFANTPTQGAGSHQTAPAQAQSTQTVKVVASGQVTTAPDRAIIHIAVTARGDSIAAVQQQMAANASQMRTALEAAGLNANQIVSAGFEIDRNFEAREDPTEPQFRGRHSFVITLNKTDRAGEVVVTAVENGATRVESVRFTITSDTRRQLKQDALRRAVKHGRKKATAAAAAAGLTLDTVQTVQTVGVSTEPVIREQGLAAGYAAAGGGDVAPSFEAGKVTVTTRALVVYNATAA